MFKLGSFFARWVCETGDRNSLISSFLVGPNLTLRNAVRKMFGGNFRSKLRSAGSAAQTFEPIHGSAGAALDGHQFAALHTGGLPILIFKAHSLVGAFARAIHRVFAPRLSVGAQLTRRLHDWIATRLASESESFGFDGVFAAMDFVVGVVARLTTKFLHFCETIMAGVILPALDADFMGWHRFSPGVVTVGNYHHTRALADVNSFLMGGRKWL
jgi:hypothetical protein